jgi:hypothetical protein
MIEVIVDDVGYIESFAWRLAYVIKFDSDLWQVHGFILFIVLNYMIVPFVLSGVPVLLMLFVFTYTGVLYDFHSR